MNINKKTSLIALSMLALGSLGSVAIQTHAQSPESSKQSVEKGKHKTFTDSEIANMKAMRASHEAIKKAFETSDYNAFHTAVAGNIKAEAITQSQFNTLLEAQKIMKDAGLFQMGMHKGHGLKVKDWKNK